MTPARVGLFPETKSGFLANRTAQDSRVILSFFRLPCQLFRVTRYHLHDALLLAPPAGAFLQRVKQAAIGVRVQNCGMHVVFAASRGAVAELAGDFFDSFH